MTGVNVSGEGNGRDFPMPSFLGELLQFDGEVEKPRSVGGG